LSAQGLVVRCLHLGLPDRYIEHAEHAEQLASCGLDAAGIVASVRAELDRLAPDDAAQASFELPRQQGIGA
jgi:1-deoxy-D-xylulose-5-phosphate synthase